MIRDHRLSIALVYHRAYEAKRRSRDEENRFEPLQSALAAAGLDAQLLVYHDEARNEIRTRLRALDGALVWVNPVEEGRDRSLLDSLLRQVAADGVFVSAHPDVILALGTKAVLYRTRQMGWSADTHLYRSLEEMKAALPTRLWHGPGRVLKRNRGQSGDGVFKVQLVPGSRRDAAPPSADSRVLLRHAKRGSQEEEITLGELFDRFAPDFERQGPILDQAYQVRLPEGMIRCYLVHDRVAGFGHQAINALHPAPPDAPASAAPEPGPRLYHPDDEPGFQRLKRSLEELWLPELKHLFDIEAERLPVLWDCDFLLGDRDESGEDTYVLCEINVSSVAPFPPSAVPHIVEAVGARLQAARAARTRR